MLMLSGQSEDKIAVVSMSSSAAQIAAKLHGAARHVSRKLRRNLHLTQASVHWAGRKGQRAMLSAGRPMRRGQPVSGDPMTVSFAQTYLLLSFNLSSTRKINRTAGSTTCDSNRVRMTSRSDLLQG